MIDLRTAITMISVFTSLGFYALVTLVARAIDVRLVRKMNRFVTVSQSRRLFALFSSGLGFRFAGEGNLLSELPRQYLIMSNHQSLLDIPLFMRFLDANRLRFVAKEELARHIPLVSTMLKANQHCLVKRSGSPSRAMRAMDIFAERAVEHDWIPVIFPEGTRSVDGTLGTFHAAGFRRLLDKAPMPVAVCAVEGGWKISTLVGMAKNLSGGRYRVKVLKIYPAPANKAEQLLILEEGKELIARQLAEWRA